MNLKHLFTKLNPFAKKDPAPKASEETLPEPLEEKVIAPPKRKFGGHHETHKLEESEKQLIVSWWATGLSPHECSERAREELNVDISSWQIVKYSRYEKWQPLIKKIKQEYFSDIASVSGSHKKVRLERHERVYERAIKKNDLKHAISATEHQRKEMEGGGDTVTNNNIFVKLSDDELEYKKKEVLERIKLMSNKGVIDVKPTDQDKATGA